MSKAGHSSRPTLDMTRGVPQGSTLGPLGLSFSALCVLSTLLDHIVSEDIFMFLLLCKPFPALTIVWNPAWSLKLFRLIEFGLWNWQCVFGSAQTLSYYTQYVYTLLKNLKATSWTIFVLFRKCVAMQFLCQLWQHFSMRTKMKGYFEILLVIDVLLFSADILGH